MALVAIGVLAVGFLLWFLIALTLEKNGTHFRRRTEFQIDGASTDAIERKPIREVSAPRSWPSGLDFARTDLVTHRAVRAVAIAPKRRLTDESWQAGRI
jgi:hypothetical protein